LNYIALVPGRRVDPEILAAIAAWISRSLDIVVRIEATMEEPAEAYDLGRRQYSSTAILHRLTELAPQDAARVVAVTEQDIYIPMLSFIFGQAQLEGRAAIVSLARLRQEFYALPPDPELCRERACKEVLHELGHTLGLIHCDDPECTMSLSTSIQQVDAKSGAFCPACSKQFAERLRRLDGLSAGPSEEEAP
jgi:archaemetzincin